MSRSDFIVYQSYKIQSFQYRILNRIITCNHWLYNVKIKNSPLCDCGEDDTIEHFFIVCTECHNFWKALINWCENTAKIKYDWDNTDIMFGIGGSDPNAKTLNYIIILAKKYIHDQKLTNNKVSFLSFLQLLKGELELEKLICLKQDKEPSFNKKWGDILENL